MHAFCIVRSGKEHSIGARIVTLVSKFTVQKCKTSYAHFGLAWHLQLTTNIILRPLARVPTTDLCAPMIEAQR
jgi:hypothetical protein